MVRVKNQHNDSGQSTKLAQLFQSEIPSRRSDRARRSQYRPIRPLSPVCSAPTACTHPSHAAIVLKDSLFRALFGILIPRPAGSFERKLAADQNHRSDKPEASARSIHLEQTRPRLLW